MTTLKAVQDFLLKARRRLSDETPDYADIDDENYDDYSEGDEDNEEQDDADRWLAEQKSKVSEPTDEPEEQQSPDVEPEEQEAPAPPPPKVVAKPPTRRVQGEAVSPPSPVTPPVSENELQPSREELAQIRQYTRPWEQRARDKAKLEAEAHINPQRHAQGHLIEARNTSHADRQKAYETFAQSPEFQNADPITQMEMEAKFHEDWHKQNPEHLVNALNAHHEAHKRGSRAMDAFNQQKDEKIRHIAGGGVQPGAMSMEEGMQHIGGSRDDEDSGPSGIQQDKAAAFAAGNQEFLQQYMENYDKKAKKFSNVSEMDIMDPETRADVNAVLGDHPALKDPIKKRQVDRFIERYHPLIGKAARHVLGKLGLTEKANRGEIDPGLLHEAGIHALFQAVNDYDHDHPSKAKFTTHLNGKMRGLMQSALRAQDEIPSDLRIKAKSFNTKMSAERASPVKMYSPEEIQSIQGSLTPPSQIAKEKMSGVKKPSLPAPAPSPKKSLDQIASAHPPDVQDRLKRVSAARAPVIRKQAATTPKPVQPATPKRNIRYISEDEGGEE